MSALDYILANYQQEKYQASLAERTVLKALVHTLNKAELPMLFTLFGIVMEVRPEQRLNALLPMLVTLFGIVTEVRPEQP